MPTFEIVTGPMRAGKSTYAASVEIATCLNLDTLLPHPYSLSQFVDTLADRLNANPQQNFVLDGWFTVYNRDPQLLVELQKRVKHDISLTIFYAGIDLLLSYSHEIEKPAVEWQTKERILRFYRKLWRVYVETTSPIRFRTRVGETSAQDFSLFLRGESMTATMAQIHDFKQRLRRRTHDLEYQTIKLPFGQTIPSRGEDTSAIVHQLAAVVPLRGKSVIDIGCYHCDATFALEDYGARLVVGMDAVPGALDTAHDLRNIWGYHTVLACDNFDTYRPTERFDIAMCLNTIQYCKDIPAAVAKLFRLADTVIIEAYPKYRPIFDAHGYRLAHESESCRWLPPSTRRDLCVYEAVK